MAKSVPKSVTIPKPLAEEARREAQEKLKHAYRQYVKEQNPEKKLAANDDLIRSIFGADSIA